MKIKICGLKYINNIKDIVQQQPDYIGFIFYPQSKRYADGRLVLPLYTRSIKEIKKVGVFVNAPFEEIIDIVDRYGLDMVQLHGNETPSLCKKINKSIPVIKAFNIHPRFDFNTLTDYATSCSYFLFDTATKEFGGSGKSFDWQLLSNYKLKKHFFLSGGICLENINQIKELNDSRLFGIDVNSCFETKPGLKDITKIKSLLHEIRN